MEVNRPSVLNDRSLNPLIVIEGIEDVIKKDLDKHKAILDRTKTEIISYRNAVSGEIRKKRHYKTLVGGGKYNDESLKNSIEEINGNIRHYQDKVKLSQDKIDFETNIVDTLSNQLKTQYEGLKVLKEHRKSEQDASNNKLGK